jgi:hypothetical protein
MTPSSKQVDLVLLRNENGQISFSAFLELFHLQQSSLEWSWSDTLTVINIVQKEQSRHDLTEFRTLLRSEPDTFFSF